MTFFSLNNTHPFVCFEEGGMFDEGCSEKYFLMTNGKEEVYF
jgi:hypothetical protein